MASRKRYDYVRPVGSPRDLKYNSFYFFTYYAECIETGKCHVYDMYPFVIFLHFDRTTALGVNLHWIPKNKREKFVELIFEWGKIYYGEKRVARKLRLFYAAIKYDMQLRQYAYTAIRRYFYHRMRYIYEIPSIEWFVKRKLKTKKWGTPKFVFAPRVAGGKPVGVVVKRGD